MIIFLTVFTFAMMFTVASACISLIAIVIRDRQRQTETEFFEYIEKHSIQVY